MLKKTGRRPVGTTPCGEMGIALWRKHSAGHQHFWRPVGMVSNHAVACVEALIQVHRFDQAVRHRNAERDEFVAQRADNGPVEGRLMQAVVENVVLVSRMVTVRP